MLNIIIIFFFFVNNFLLKYRYAQQLKKREKGV